MFKKSDTTNPYGRRGYDRNTIVLPTLLALVAVMSGAYLMNKRVAYLEECQRGHDERKKRREWWLTKALPSFAAIATVGLITVSTVLAVRGVK